MPPIVIEAIVFAGFAVCLFVYLLNRSHVQALLKICSDYNGFYEGNFVHKKVVIQRDNIEPIINVSINIFREYDRARSPCALWIESRLRNFSNEKVDTSHMPKLHVENKYRPVFSVNVSEISKRIFDTEHPEFIRIGRKLGRRLRFCDLATGPGFSSLAFSCDFVSEGQVEGAMDMAELILNYFN
jgi:hypothetical protein